MKKICLIAFAFLFVFLANSFSVAAAEPETIPLLEEIALPDDLDFEVNDSCSEHAYFLQAAANSKGGFAVFSRHVNFKNGYDYELKKAYIDVYNPDGTFSQELSFFTTFDFAFLMDTDCIKIYFYQYALIYDLETRDLTCFAIPKGSLKNSGLYYQLNERKFSVGKWNYECKKGLNGFVELNRTNDTNTQKLLEMSGSSNLVLKVFLPAAIGGLIFAIASRKLWKRISKRHRPTD